MPLSTMAAVMLLIALASGLLERSLQNLHIGHFAALAFTVFAAFLRIATVSFSPEYEINAGCVFTVCMLFAAAAAADGKACLKAIPAAAVCAVPAAALMQLPNRDAAVLLAAAIPAAAFPVIGSQPVVLLTAVLTPVLSAAYTLLFGLISSGYGSFELNGFILDIEWVGILLVSLLFELSGTKPHRIKSVT